MTFSCDSLCSGKSVIGSEWGATGTNILNAAMGLVGVPPVKLGAGPDLSVQDDLSKNMDKLNAAITGALAENERYLSNEIGDELVVLTQMLDVSANETKLLLGGAIGINTELLIYYGIILVLLILNEVFKRN